MRKIFTIFFLLLTYLSYAQQPGKIIIPSYGFTPTPLNPNGDGYTSKTSTGFVTNDVTESEIPYKAVTAFVPESTGDISRGPVGGFTDIIGPPDGSGLYVFNDGTNILFRMRIGNYISGSKGYCVLIDTDQKFGNSGAAADPNYIAGTTGVSGNPGFELEVSFEKNFRVAVYNVDGTTSPTLMSSYPVSTNSQISVALTTDSNNPDYFYDFYVPLSSLGLAPGTAIRLVPTTVMSPQSAIGGPASDRYVPDNITYQPAVKLDSLTSGSGAFPPACTAAPVITSTMISPTVAISGTWSRKLSTEPSTATINLYKNAVLIGSTICTTGTTWTLTNLPLAAGDTIYAMAQSAGESMCFQSASIKVPACSIASQTTTTGLGWTCATQRGFSGTRPSGAAVRIYLQSFTGTTLFANDNSTTYKVTYPTATTWYYDDASGGGGVDPCTGGPNEISNGSYSLTAQLSGYCESAYVSYCLGVTSTATPTISQTILYPTNKIISGTATSFSLVSLYINNALVSSVTASFLTGSYSFSNLNLSAGDIVSVSAIASGQCMSNAATLTVGCITATAPMITADKNNNLQVGITSISGTSLEAAGTVVTVYKNGISIGNTTVQSNGSWSLAYTIVPAKYSASQQTGACLASAVSSSDTALSLSTICPTITGSYNQYSTSVDGTLPSSFTGNIKLYIDSVLIKTLSVTGATAFSFPVNTDYSDRLYPGGKIYVTAQESGKLEGAACPDNTQTVLCSAPSTPNVTTPSPVNIFVNQKATFNVGNTANGILYVLKDNADTKNQGTSEFGTTSTIALVTDTFHSPGNYVLKIKALDFSGANCESYVDVSVTVLSNSTLPITITSLSGYFNNGNCYLNWIAENETNIKYYGVERSDDGRNFTTIAKIAAGSAINKKYQAIDLTGSTNYIYYRIKINDVTNKSYYTNVIKIKPGNIATNNLVFANPFQDKISAFYNTIKTETITFQLFDITGKMLIKKTYKVSAGNNPLILDGVSQLSNGSYIIIVKGEGGEQIAAEKIQKQ